MPTPGAARPRRALQRLALAERGPCRREIRHSKVQFDGTDRFILNEVGDYRNGLIGLFRPPDFEVKYVIETVA
jgi:hypothetical protein